MSDMSSEVSPTSADQSGGSSANPRLVQSYAAVVARTPVNRSNSVSYGSPSIQRPYVSRRRSTHGRGRGENKSVSGPGTQPLIPRKPNAPRQQTGARPAGARPGAIVTAKQTRRTSSLHESTVAPTRGLLVSNDSSAQEKRAKGAHPPSGNGGPSSRQQKDGPPLLESSKRESSSNSGSSKSSSSSSSSSPLNSKADSGKSTALKEDSSNQDSIQMPQASSTAASGAGKQRSWVLRRNLYQSGAVTDPNWAALQKQAEEARARAAANAKKKNEQAINAIKEAIKGKEHAENSQSSKPQVASCENSVSDDEPERLSKVKFNSIVTVYEDDIAGKHIASIPEEDDCADTNSDKDEDEDSGRESD